MRNLDSCRYWRCTLCPCKVRNKFLVNFETAPFFCVYPVYVSTIQRERIVAFTWQQWLREDAIRHLVRILPVLFNKRQTRKKNDVSFRRFVIQTKKTIFLFTNYVLIYIYFPKLHRVYCCANLWATKLSFYIIHMDVSLVRTIRFLPLSSISGRRWRTLPARCATTWPASCADCT